eukprot:COSAG05_NODE_287_length_12131_cov_3.148022_5_plen_154_part_00
MAPDTCLSPPLPALCVRVCLPLSPSLSFSPSLCVCVCVYHTHTHTAQVRSLDLDTREWSPSQCELMHGLGNLASNAVWEANLAAVQHAIAHYHTRSVPEICWDLCALTFVSYVSVGFGLTIMQVLATRPGAPSKPTNASGFDRAAAERFIRAK